MDIPDHYKGREQAYLKHRLLQAYLERLFYIVGHYQKTICYVDCFAGPWHEQGPDLEGTSIATSLNMYASKHPIFISINSPAKILLNKIGRGVSAMTLEDRKTFWKKLVKEHGQSQLSVTDFCRNHRINPQRFYVWRKRFQSQPTTPNPGAFLELVPTSKKTESGIRLRMESGMSIELDCQFDSVTLRQVISILR